jgi:hypothetical protein
VLDAPFKNCKLKDESDLNNLIVGNVSKPFSVDVIPIAVKDDKQTRIVSIIRVPRSTNKPHILDQYIRGSHKYPHFTPVKHGGSIRAASRAEFDQMYFDNQLSIPEYAIDIQIAKNNRVDINPGAASHFVSLPIVFENYGRKPVVIVAGLLRLTDTETTDIVQTFSFSGYNPQSSNPLQNFDISSNPIAVQSNFSLPLFCRFYASSNEIKSHFGGKNYNYFIECEDVIGNTYKSPVRTLFYTR